MYYVATEWNELDICLQVYIYKEHYWVKKQSMSVPKF